MYVVKIRQMDSSMMIVLPPSVVEAFHLQENDEIAVDVVEDCIVLTRVNEDFQNAWNAYQAIEPHYRNANGKLAE